MTQVVQILVKKLLLLKSPQLIVSRVFLDLSNPSAKIVVEVLRAAPGRMQKETKKSMSQIVFWTNIFQNLVSVFGCASETSENGTNKPERR